MGFLMTLIQNICCFMILIEIEPNGAKVMPWDPKSEIMAPQGEQNGANWVQE
jgi:hypothetical protein